MAESERSDREVVGHCVRILKIGGAEFRLDPPAVDDVPPFGEFADDLQVLFDERDGHAELLVDAGGVVGDLLDHRGLDPLRGFVEREELRGSNADAIAVTIEEIEPRGTTGTVPYFGGRSAADRTAMRHGPLPELVRKPGVTTERTVRSDDIIPYEPFVGTIGTSPEIDSVNAPTPFKHGGETALPDV